MASGAGDSGFRNLGLNHERRLVTPNVRQLEPNWRMAQTA
jgi:hypothetical protein